jgi:alpha-D-xyloside xylohydrolase
MGQYQQEILNLKGCNLELAHRNSQVSIPFYISNKGYGFLWHNAAIGEVHFGKNTTEWVSEASKQLDYWITAGDTPAEILGAFTAATGKPPMMPEYGLGYWQCKLRYYNQDEVLKIAKEHKERNIPLDVLVIDYFHWLRCGDFKFDKEFFPDPGAMVKELKEMGIQPMVSFWPQVDWRSENYNEMKQQGLLVKSNNGVDVQLAFLGGNHVFLDPTNPRTREYVWNKCKKNYYDLGIENFWLDEAEPEFNPYDFEHYRYHLGAVSEVGNVFPREYERLFYEGLQSAGKKDVVSLCRCAWVGSQRYGALVWSGDIHSTYEDFRKQICAGIHMGLCGIPWWTTDIGGFIGGNINDENFKELLIRWFQYGTFLPVMRMHGLRQPTKKIIDKVGEHREITGADNEIWSYGEENYKIMRKFIDIREMMRGYIRSLMKTAHESGTPVIRALFYEFPDDETGWDIKDEYMFGGDILVAPVCYEKATSRKVYLPEGANWTFARDGKVYDGGITVEVDTPIDTIPIFLKNGKQEYLIGKV